MEHVLQIKDTSREPDHIIRNAMRSILFAMFLHQLLTNTATLVDTLIVGKFYGDIALGACGITYNLVFINITLGVFLPLAHNLCVPRRSAWATGSRQTVFSRRVLFSA